MNEPSNVASRASAGVGDVAVVKMCKTPACGTTLIEGSFSRWFCPKCEGERCRRCGEYRLSCCC